MTQYSHPSSGAAPGMGSEAAPTLAAAAAVPDLFGSLHDAITRAALDPIIVADQDARIVMTNPAALRMFGCNSEAMLGSCLSRFIPEHHRATHANRVRAFDASGATELLAAQHRPDVGLRCDGEQFPVDAALTRLDVASAPETTHHFVAVLRDISAIRGLHDDVELLQKRMIEIIELAPVAIWITEEEHITYANQSCERLFQVDGKRQLVGRCIYEFLHEDSHTTVRRAIRNALDSNTVHPALRERITQPGGRAAESPPASTIATNTDNALHRPAAARGLYRWTGSMFRVESANHLGQCPFSTTLDFP